MESREDFYFDNSDNLESDDTIEKEEHYKWTIALEEIGRASCRERV